MGKQLFVFCWFSLTIMTLTLWIAVTYQKITTPTPPLVWVAEPTERELEIKKFRETKHCIALCERGGMDYIGRGPTVDNYECLCYHPYLLRTKVIGVNKFEPLHK